MEWNWHASHLVTCAVASWRAVGQKKPCRKALPASALAPMWWPHMPPCISANSFCPSSRQIHFNFTPLSLLLYSMLSTNWYILDCRATLSASSCSSGSSPVWRKWRCARSGTSVSYMHWPTSVHVLRKTGELPEDQEEAEKVAHQLSMFQVVVSILYRRIRNSGN